MWGQQQLQSSQSSAHISCPRGLLSAPVTVGTRTSTSTSPSPGLSLPSVVQQFPLLKIIRYVFFLFLLYLFCNWWHPIAGAELDWLWNVDRSNQAGWDERERASDVSRQARDVCINFLTPPKSPYLCPLKMLRMRLRPVRIKSSLHISSLSFPFLCFHFHFSSVLFRFLQIEIMNVGSIISGKQSRRRPKAR